MTNFITRSRLHLGASLAVLLFTVGCGSETAIPSVPVVPMPAAVTVAPQAIRLAPGEGAQLVAGVLDARGTTIDNSSIVWTSSMPSVATVASDGAIKAVGFGGTTMTATAQGVSGSAMVTVERP